MGQIFGHWNFDGKSPEMDFGNQTVMPKDSGLLFGVSRSEDDKSTEGVASYRHLHAAFVGEIINFRSLCDQFQVSKSANCAELILRMYERQTTNIFPLINGRYCVAIYDEQKRSVTLFSDRSGGFYGLFYAQTAQSFTFGNQIQSILSLSQIPRELDTQALFTFFSRGYVSPPQTFIKNIYKNWPGEAVILHGEGKKLERSFVDLIPFAPTIGARKSVEEFEDILRTAVKDASSDLTKSAFLLSGGIDSSSIVALASELSNSPLTTFSGAFPGTEFDESPFAMIVAKKYGCNASVVDMSGMSGIEQLPEIIQMHNEPTVDYSCLPTYTIFSHVRKTNRVIFGGDGPDHFFGRYYPVAAKQSVSYLSPLYQVLYALSHKDAFARLHWGASRTLQESYFGLFSLPSWGTANISRIPELFTDAVTKEPYPFDPLLPGNLEKRSNCYEELFHKTVFLDTLIDGAFGVFKKVGSMSHATDVKLCLPFMDRRVQDFIFQLPREQRVYGNFWNAFASNAKTKYLLKYGMGPKVLPEDIIAKNKGGFTPPLVNWFRQTLCKSPASKVLSPELQKAGIFQIDFVDRILSEHRDSVRNWTTIIFMIISFDLWYQSVICNGKLYRF